MNETTLIYLILGAGLVPLNTKIIFDWLKGMNKKKNGNGVYEKVIQCPIDRSDMINKINWLRAAHDVKDGDGRPIWYFPQSVEKKFDKMIEHLEKIEKKL